MCLILGFTEVAHLMPAASAEQPDMPIPQLQVGMPDCASRNHGWLSHFCAIKRTDSSSSLILHNTR